MAENVILEEQVLDAFALYEEVGLYGHMISRVELTVGDTYKVVWDGTPWTCVAQDFSALMAGAVVLGNVSAFGGSGNNEPFIIVTESTSDLDSDIFSLTDTEPSVHTVAIYEGATGGADQQEGIILLDYKDEPTAYYGREVLEVPSTVEGESVNYVREDLVPETLEKTLELDFSGGAMTVTPEAGQAFSEVNIPVPEGLAPENIPEGMTVAGIVGAMVAGGGANIKMACGSFAGTGAAVTVEHGLGVVPDILFVGVDNNSTNTQNFTVKMAFGISSSLQSLLGTNNASYYLTSSFVSGANHKLSIGKMYATGTIDKASTTNILTANATSFRVGATGITTQWQTDPTRTYDWYAIGGLA